MPLLPFFSNVEVQSVTVPVHIQSWDDRFSDTTCRLMLCSLSCSFFLELAVGVEQQKQLHIGHY